MNKNKQNKAASPCQGEAAKEIQLNLNNTPSDPLRQWFELAANAKQSRNRLPKSSWKRGRK